MQRAENPNPKKTSTRTTNWKKVAIHQNEIYHQTLIERSIKLEVTCKQ